MTEFEKAGRGLCVVGGHGLATCVVVLSLEKGETLRQGPAREFRSSLDNEYVRNDSSRFATAIRASQ